MNATRKEWTFLPNRGSELHLWTQEEILTFAVVRTEKLTLGLSSNKEPYATTL